MLLKNKEFYFQIFVKVHFAIHCDNKTLKRKKIKHSFVICKILIMKLLFLMQLKSPEVYDIHFLNCKLLSIFMKKFPGTDKKKFSLHRLIQFYERKHYFFQLDVQQKRPETIIIIVSTRESI